MRRFLDNLPIRIKVALPAAFVLLALIATAVIAALILERNKESVADLKQRAFERYHLASEAAMAAQEMQSDVMRVLALAAHGADARQVKATGVDVAAASTAAATALTALARNVGDEDARIPALIQTFTLYRAAVNQVLDIVGDDPASGRLLLPAVATANQNLAALLDAFEREAYRLGLERAGDVVAVADKAELVFFAILAAAVVLSLAVSTLAARAIARPVNALTMAMKQLAEGDVAVAVPDAERGDEIGTMAEAVAVFKHHMIEGERLHKELLMRERLSAIGQLTATVAHELRNPLSAIRNSAHSARQLAAASGVELERPLGRIDRAIERCNRLVNDLLDYARTRELQRTATRLDAWLTDLLNEKEIPEGIVIERQLAATGTVIAVDRHRLRQVVENLIDNAAQAMADPRMEGRPRRIVLSSSAGEQAVIAISDTGPGISPEHLARIFEPLFTTKPAGTGLGLPTVKQIVEQHGGTVEVESELGRGTQVRVILPGTCAAAAAA